ncbi:MAG TPA: hypothetical protein VIC58_10780 [Actinomycetota bacterium]
MLAQVSPNPTVTPTLNDGGWVYNAAMLLWVLGILLAIAVVFAYMRYAPRFQTDEEGRKTVKVPRRQPGKEVRRPVTVTGVPMVVQPPVVAAPAQVPAAVAAPAAAPAPAAPAAPAAAAPAPTPAAAPAPAAAATPAPAAPAEAAPAAAPAPAPAAEHKEVTLDQATFDRVLAELLEKGTDRRVAEGQAKRAAMIAARKQAEG